LTHNDVQTEWVYWAVNMTCMEMTLIWRTQHWRTTMYKLSACTELLIWHAWRWHWFDVHNIDGQRCTNWVSVLSC